VHEICHVVTSKLQGTGGDFSVYECLHCKSLAVNFSVSVVICCSESTDKKSAYVRSFTSQMFNC